MKKIRWTLDLIKESNITTLSKKELRRALNFGSWRVNERINKLKKYQETHGIEVPSLKYITDPGTSKNSKAGQGNFYINDNMSIQELRYEFKRLQNFLNMKTSSIKGVETFYKERRSEIKKVFSDLGASTEQVDKLLDEDISKFYSIFRKAIELVGDYDSTRLKEVSWNNFINNNTNVNDLLNNIVQDYNKQYLIDEDLEDDEEWNPLGLRNT